MPITIKPHVHIRISQPKVYLVSIVYDRHISWEFCMRILINIFHKDQEEATKITNDTLNIGEGLCGAYMYEIAESKANLVEEMAKKEGFSLKCLIEEV